MASYDLNCLSCGKPFEACQRNARTCSHRCARRLREGVRVAPTSDVLHQDHSRSLSASTDTSLPTPRQGGEVPNRTFAIVRARHAPAEAVIIDRLGRITKGAFTGVRIGDLLRTAAKQGWFAYRRRPDGWYAAEWWPERKTITLCGPCALPQVSATAIGDDIAKAA